MSPLQVLLVVAYAGLFASALPVIVGVRRLSRRPAGYRLLWVWLLLGFLLNALMEATNSRGIRNAGIGQVGYLVLGVLGLYCLSRLVSSALVRRWILAGAALYVPLWFWRFFAGETAEPFSRVAGPVLWILLTLAAAAVVGARLSLPIAAPGRDPAVLTGFAFIVSYAPAAALEPVSAELFSHNPDLTRWLYTARGLLLLAGFVLFTLVFLWTTPPPRSSGSSSSVG